MFQITSEKDIIVHLAPTPVPDEGDLSSEEEEAVPRPKQEPNKSKYPDSIPKVVESTVSQHARQVGDASYSQGCGVRVRFRRIFMLLESESETQYVFCIIFFLQIIIFRGLSWIQTK